MRPKLPGTPIVTLAKTGANLTHSLGADTSLPGGATHLLVFTKNADGEMATGISAAIDDLGVPENAPVGIAFTDSDIDGGELGGTVTITKATDESDVTHYVLYWGSDSSTKLSGQSAVDTIAKTGADVSHIISASTAIPANATHLIAFTKNAGGEMATGVNVAIGDVGIPSNAAAGIAFTDSDLDGGELEGTVTITKAGDESDVTHYVLYWGSDSSTKLGGQSAIDTIAKTGANVSHVFAADTSIPTNATHLLVLTKNADGEMATGVNVAIGDLGVPEHAAQSVAFTDGDTDEDEISGDVTITKATDESDVTHYVLYWGSDSSTKLVGQSAINTIVKTGADVTHSFSASTAIPTNATHLLVFTKNDDGEMGTGVNVEITDVTGLNAKVCVFGGAYHSFICAGSEGNYFDHGSWMWSGSDTFSINTHIEGLTSADISVYERYSSGAGCDAAGISSWSLIASSLTENSTSISYTAPPSSETVYFCSKVIMNSITYYINSYTFVVVYED